MSLWTLGTSARGDLQAIKSLSIKWINLILSQLLTINYEGKYPVRVNPWSPLPLKMGSSGSWCQTGTWVRIITQSLIEENVLWEVKQKEADKGTALQENIHSKSLRSSMQFCTWQHNRACWGPQRQSLIPWDLPSYSNEVTCTSVLLHSSAPSLTVFCSFASKGDYQISKIPVLGTDTSPDTFIQF